MLAHEVPGMEFMNALFSIVWCEFDEIMTRIKQIDDDPSKRLVKTPRGDKITATKVIIDEMETKFERLFADIVSGNVCIMVKSIPFSLTL